MYVVNVNSRFVGADKSKGRAARHENVADARRYPTMQAAQAAARNVGGTVQTVRQAERSMHVSMALASLRARRFSDANYFMDRAI